MSNDSSNDDREGARDPRRSVSALATAVISALSDRPGAEDISLRTAIVRILVKAALREGGFTPERVLHDLQDERVDNNQIVDIYIPAAARELGDMWSADAIGFAKVTIATARLQGLLTLLAPPWSATVTDGKDAANVVMVLQDSDSHTLGPHVATAQLRRLGASVRLLFGPDAETLVQVLEDERFDLILFSCSRTETLESVARMVKRIKGLEGMPPVALGGLVLTLTDKVKEKTGVDLVTGDVRVAFKLCEKKRQTTRSLAIR